MKTITKLSLFFTVILLPIIWFYFLIPVHLTVKHAADTVVTVYVDGTETSLKHYSHTSEHRLEVLNLSKENQIVELALPIPDGSPRLKLDQFEVVSDGWTPTHNGERVESGVNGSRLVFTVRSAEPELAFLQRADGGNVSVSSDDGFKTSLNLRSDSYGFRTIKLPAREVVTVSYIGSIASISDTFVKVSGGNKDSLLLANLGGGRLLTSVTIPPEQQYHLILKSKFQLLVLVAEDFYFPLGVALLFVIFFSNIGKLLLAPLSLKGDFIVNPLLAFASGLSIFALINNTASYFFSGNEIAPFVFVIFLLTFFYVVYWMLRNKSIDYFRFSSLSKGGLLAGLASVWLGFWPASIAGNAYLGFLQTDSFFYTNVSTAIQNLSLFEYIEKGGLIGYGLRSIDLSLAAVLASSTNLPTSTVWLALCMLFMFLPPIFAYELVLKWRESKRIALVTSWAVAMSAPLAGLFFEAYFAQFLLVGFLYMNLYTGWHFYQSIVSGQLKWQAILSFILVSAVIILLYPYFAVLTFVIIGVVFFRAIKIGQVKIVFLIIILILLFDNIGVYFLFNHAATDSFTPRLNEIAQYVVFPFYKKAKFASFILGFTPFHGTAELFLNIASEFHNVIFTGMAYFVQVTSGKFSWILVFVVIYIYVHSLWLGRRYFLSGFSLVILIVFSCYVALMLLSFMFSGLYAYAKLTWTVGALLPILIIPTILSPSNIQAETKKSRALKISGIIIVTILIFSNGLSKLLTGFLWVANPYAAVGNRVNTVVAGPILHIQELITHKLYNRADFMFYCASDANCQKDQKAMVLAAHLYSYMLSMNYSCINCDLSWQLLDYRGFRVNKDINFDAKKGVVIQMDTFAPILVK
ncbi:hypothetical protein [Serratia microhaemolytica]|uniref:hypothetical protein n=1 Tax=Serratia microhaemolytica TaxID=2675110 RepID=UPI000FDE088B|nr:hypothetical protein [Serratia microhaemolytica]